MDKLTLVVQQKVRKMSDEQLMAKLVDVGHDKTWRVNETRHKGAVKVRGN